MSEVKKELKYTKEHEWASKDGDLIVIGITDHAQDSLGEIVYLELPAVGDSLEKDSAFGAVESTKSVSDLYSPSLLAVLSQVATWLNTTFPGEKLETLILPITSSEE